MTALRDTRRHGGVVRGTRRNDYQVTLIEIRIELLQVKATKP